ncbi:hypothetical protein [Agaribacterium haliotis]|uniref:hypothetical protein n=1 Tax=Agaribacterium haliotis TaxID=2013869 RepID=UPI001177BD8F|nr:hypothetical protein [Agaribacterium haliotis]
MKNIFLISLLLLLSSSTLAAMKNARAVAATNCQAVLASWDPVISSLGGYPVREADYYTMSVWGRFFDGTSISNTSGKSSSNYALSSFKYPSGKTFNDFETTSITVWAHWHLYDNNGNIIPGMAEGNKVRAASASNLNCS